MSEERRVPEELARYDAELAGIERDVERRIDPGAAAVAVTVAVLVLVGALMLPWTGSTAGWEALAGTGSAGPLPRLFAGAALGFGAVGSVLALATRWWGLAWVCAVGCGFSVVAGVWAIWSRQVGVPDGATGPGIGLVLAVLAVLALAVTWVRIALRH
ncbi:MAG TPA: hypothetical protein VM367_18555 [Pseudonocardia sp.]|nr:hypothetical protein [Pseudonocardia sp.]